MEEDDDDTFSCVISFYGDSSIVFFSFSGIFLLRNFSLHYLLKSLINRLLAGVDILDY